QVLQRELPARVPQIALTKGWCGQAVVSSVWSLVFVVSSAVAVAPARPPTPGRELTGREPTMGRPLLRRLPTTGRPVPPPRVSTASRQGRAASAAPAPGISRALATPAVLRARYIQVFFICVSNPSSRGERGRRADGGCRGRGLGRGGPD